MKNHTKDTLDLNIEKILSAVRNNAKDGQRDATMVLMMYRYGLSIKELLLLRWEQIDTKLGLLYSENLAKNNFAPIYPLFASELTALQKIQRQHPESKYVFVSENQSRLTVSTFRKIIKRAFVEAKVVPIDTDLGIYRKKYLAVGDNYIY